MKKGMVKHLPPFITVILLSVFCAEAKAQKTDSIFFHLYTDSLKKGTYNYINVDGKLADGSWFPLSDKQLAFTTTGGRFERNSLILDTGFHEEKVTVTAVLKADTLISKSVTIFLKKLEDSDRLKTKEEVMQEITQPKPRKQRNR